MLPLVILPLLLFTLGVSRILASLGTYLRNLGPLVGVLLTALLFLSPIFYPIEAVPESWRDLMYLNPLTLVIENTRQVMLWGRLPDLSAWSLSVLASAGVAWFGLVFFRELAEDLPMSSEIVLCVEGLSKCYRSYGRPRDRLLQMLPLAHGFPCREFRALENVSFEMNRGEAIGVVGRKGLASQRCCNLSVRP